MVEQAKKLLCDMQSTRAIATVSYLRHTMDTLDLQHVKLVLQAASGPLRRGGAGHVFLDEDKVCLDQDLFDEDLSTLALKGGHEVSAYQCVRLQAAQLSADEPRSKRSKKNSITFDLKSVDFAVVQHMPNYFEVVTRVDPILQDMIMRTPEEHLSVEVAYDTSVSFVHDDSYDSVIVPLVIRNGKELRVSSAVLLVVQKMNAVKDDCLFGDSVPFACRAI